MKFINLHLNGQRQIDNYFIFFDHACSIAQVRCTRNLPQPGQVPFYPSLSVELSKAFYRFQSYRKANLHQYLHTVKFFRNKASPYLPCLPIITKKISPPFIISACLITVPDKTFPFTETTFIYFFSSTGFER